jgi:Tfp pilus assembly protein PilE
MTGVKLVVLVIVVAILVVAGHDAYEVSTANNDVRNTARSAAADAASLLTKSHGADGLHAHAAASADVARAGDVIIDYHYDAVAQKVMVEVGASASSWVAGHIKRSWTDDITATASARTSPGP